MDFFFCFCKLFLFGQLFCCSFFPSASLYSRLVLKLLAGTGGATGAAHSQSSVWESIWDTFSIFVLAAVKSQTSEKLILTNFTLYLHYFTMLLHILMSFIDALQLSLVIMQGLHLILANSKSGNKQVWCVKICSRSQFGNISVQSDEANEGTSLLSRPTSWNTL